VHVTNIRITTLLFAHSDNSTRPTEEKLHDDIEYPYHIISLKQILETTQDTR
jgi:hypothetical protein